MNKLLWELFEMFRTLINKIEPTEANTKMLAEWAARFHVEDAGVPAPDTVEADEGEPDDDDDEHPAAHARRAAGKRRR